MTPHLAITMGDPAGVGPEIIIVKACAALKDQPRLGRSPPAHHRLQSGAAERAGAARQHARHSRSERDGCRMARPRLPSGGAGRRAHPPRRAEHRWRPLCPISPSRRAVRLAQAGRVQGLVTAPLNKEALNKAGYHYGRPHTDMLAVLTAHVAR